MSSESWLEFFGWKEKHLSELRLVAFSYLKQGKYEIARIFFEALTILSPTSSYDWQILGALHLEMKQPSEALKCFEEAFKLEPDHPITKLNQAKALLSLGHPGQAYAIAESLKNHSNPKVASSARSLLLLLDRTP